jgi:hypothetical protein
MSPRHSRVQPLTNSGAATMAEAVMEDTLGEPPGIPPPGCEIPDGMASPIDIASSGTAPSTGYRVPEFGNHQSSAPANSTGCIPVHGSVGLVGARGQPMPDNSYISFLTSGQTVLNAYTTNPRQDHEAPSWDGTQSTAYSTDSGFMPPPRPSAGQGRGQAFSPSAGIGHGGVELQNAAVTILTGQGEPVSVLAVLGNGALYYSLITHNLVDRLGLAHTLRQTPPGYQHILAPSGEPILPRLYVSLTVRSFEIPMPTRNLNVFVVEGALGFSTCNAGFFYAPPTSTSTSVGVNSHTGASANFANGTQLGIGGGSSLTPTDSDFERASFRGMYRSSRSDGRVGRYRRHSTGHGAFGRNRYPLMHQRFASHASESSAGVNDPPLGELLSPSWQPRFPYYQQDLSGIKQEEQTHWDDYTPEDMAHPDLH